MAKLTAPQVRALRVLTRNPSARYSNGTSPVVTDRPTIYWQVADKLALDGLVVISHERVAITPAGRDALKAEWGTPLTVAEYQERINAWHKRRWPDASVHKIALKMAEETGEVAGAVLKHQGDDAVLHECSDVLNVVAVLLARHGFTLDQAMAYGITVEERKRESYEEHE